MRDMSIDTVNDVLYAMTAEPTDDVSFFSFLDNPVSGKKHEHSVFSEL
jgi:hypothetical protein